MKVGDKVFVGYSGGCDMRYSQGVVVKVTPKGMVDVQIGTSTPQRFGTDGHRLGGYNPRATFLDDKPFEERVALLAQQNRGRTAANLIQGIHAQNGANYKWGKEGLMEEVVRLQGLLDAARAAVEAI